MANASQMAVESQQYTCVTDAAPGSCCSKLIIVWACGQPPQNTTLLQMMADLLALFYYRK